MAEYIDREGAYPLAKKICDAIDSKEFQRLNFGMRILDWIDDIPAADVRPVVLCRDCIHKKGEKVWEMLGDTTADCNCGHGYPPLDWFCADGEKREES